MAKIDLASDIMRKVGDVVSENRDLKHQIKSVRKFASAALHLAKEDGAVQWRDALESILRITQ